MPRVSEEYRSARQDDLFRATWTCIVRLGLENVSITDIITESGFSAGMVYNYFSGKDKLVAAAFAEAVMRLHRAITAGTEIPSPAPEKLFSQVVTAIASRPGTGDNAMAALWPIAIAASPAQLDASGLRYTVEVFLDRVEGHCRTWRATGTIGSHGTPRADAEAVLSQLLGFLFWQGLAQGPGAQGWAPMLLAVDRQSTALRNLRGENV